VVENNKVSKYAILPTTMFRKNVTTSIEAALLRAGLVDSEEGFKQLNFAVGYPDTAEHGDYTTNIALVLSKSLGKPPRKVAEAIVAALPESDIIACVEVAGPGFINFFLRPEALAQSLVRVIKEGDEFGKGKSLIEKRMMFEYTDPNPFKVFHIGHLMANTVGEACARLAEWQGATVVRTNYQGDVGLHIGRALYGMREMRDTQPPEAALGVEKVAWLADAYVRGATAHAESPEKATEIENINKAVYEKIDAEINELYQLGRRWSLDYFEELYQKLGTKFDHYIFESEVAGPGMETVRDYLAKGVFAESEGAIIYDGEKHGLHKRVFITSAGLPTYEAKDIGNQLRKFALEPTLDFSYIFTGAEQQEYMKVVLAAMHDIRPDIAEKTTHLTHGLMLGPDGKKMSSRKGGAPSGDGLLLELEGLVAQKLAVSRYDFPPEEARVVADKVAVAAVKYAILRQHFEKNIIFDHEAATSFEGDSGPYLQYTYARAKSVIRKGEDLGLVSSMENQELPGALERHLARFPEVVADAWMAITPSGITTYLIEIARLFNSYYGDHPIIREGVPETAYRLALTAAVAQVMKNGLTILGIPMVEKM